MEHQVLSQFQPYETERFTKRILFKQPGSIVFTLNFEAGQQLPAHRHPGADVYILVSEGTGTFDCDGTELAVSAGDVVHVQGDELMSYRSGENDRSSLYVTLVNIPDPGYAQDLG
ncbi:cupin domain-containing protein [Paenibacillus bovis]|uniref:Cupin n=1 Tax=Paenibacillus bovis TaxID=1616788 RepID=A0A172ZAW1_9BACL|nr:cupin domain-containing protein [Paenibacillus bovis]ANF94771.1 cupin [Paenibacillus bovis]